MISINWATKVINIPQADLTSLGGGIYQLDVNEFRQILKDLEDDADGMTFSDTHRHNTIVTVGGVTLARVVEIINGYTITFQDGQYAVNLVGANSNIPDVTNVNQVSIRSFNTAGLIQVTSGSGVTPQDIIEIADAVWDETTSAHSTAGTVGKRLIDTALESTSVLIKTKTDNLPSDPASETSITIVSNKIGTPTGASIVADIATIKTDTGDLRSDYTSVRAAKIDNLDTAISSRPTAASIAAAILATPANLLVTDSDGRVDLSKVKGGIVNDLINGRIDTHPSVLGDGAISKTTLASDMDTYQAIIWLLVDDGDNADKYTIVFHKNGQPVAGSNIINPKMSLIQLIDGTYLFQDITLDEIDNTGLFKYTTYGTRIERGKRYIAQTIANIDSVARTWYQPMGRDR